MSRVTNPILPGFHPDPSIIRVGDDYYIATSTFEWWPGVRLHHSHDLINWTPAGHAVTRRAQLDMRGNPPSGGVWAPALSHADGLFWLVYSDVKAFNGPSKDVRNFLITAPAITGPWSDPVPLNGSGFDPSLFHDDDGRKWFLNQIWDPRPDRNQFAGIALQEYCPRTRRLLGSPENIFRGSALGVTEGPHLYKQDGFYYLITAEGGTGESHAVTVARSRSLAGPYELCPDNPLLSSAGRPDVLLQKAGHGSLVRTADDSWYLAHLCSRPVGPRRRCILGRETALQAVAWPQGGWPRLAQGGCVPAASVEISGPAARPYLDEFHDDFSGAAPGPHWSFLREPPDASWLTLGGRPGALRLRGRHTLVSLFDQSLAGFRLLHPRCRVRVRLDFTPTSFQQSAGLSFYYNHTNFHHLLMTGRDGGGRELRLLCGDNGAYTNPAGPGVRVPDAGAVELRAELEGESLRFFFVPESGAAQPVGPVLDATVLSDDRVMEGEAWGFTGCFVTLSAHDSADSGISAAFTDFRYEGLSLSTATDASSPAVTQVVASP